MTAAEEQTSRNLIARHLALARSNVNMVGHDGCTQPAVHLYWAGVNVGKATEILNGLGIAVGERTARQYAYICSQIFHKVVLHS